jgi:hypothetical protein
MLLWLLPFCRPRQRGASQHVRILEPISLTRCHHFFDLSEDKYFSDMANRPHR